MGLFDKRQTLHGLDYSRGYTGQGLSDMLPYAVLAGDGLVQTKLGAWIVAYYFTPPDTAGSTDFEQSDVSDRVQVALARFGTGWSTWTDAASIPAAPYPHPDQSAFPDEISRLVDEERRRAFEAEGAHYDNERAFFFCYTPPSRKVSTFQRMMYVGGDPDVETPMAQMLQAFNRQLEAFEDECGAILGLRRMTGFRVVDEFGRERHQDELVNYLYYCVTGLTNGITLPESGAYLDCLLGSQDADIGEVIRLGDDLVMVVTIEGFAAESYPNIIAALNTLTIPYRFTQRAIYLDDLHAERDAARYRDKWSSRVTGLVAKLMASKDPRKDEHAVNMVVDASTAISLSKAGARFCYYTASVVLRHPEEAALREMARLVFQTIRNCQFSGRIETTNTFEAWRGSLPGDVRSNVRRPPLHTGNLADLLPLSGIWTGEATAPCDFYPPGSPALMYCKTVGCIPFRGNMHVGQVGHTITFGPTGAGKSGLMNSVAMQARRYAGMRITAFDYKMGMFATVKACGGNHYDLGASTEPLLCPLAHLDTPEERLQGEEFIWICFDLQHGRMPSPEQKVEIHLGIKRLAGRNLRSLTDFKMMVSDKEVRDAVNFYTLNGSVGHILDATEDRIEDSDFNVFETLRLMGLHEQVYLPVLTVLFNRFQRTLDGSPTLLFISEAWMPFKHPVWAAKLEDWLRLLRSKNCAVLMDTQNLADAVRSPIMGVLLESCPTKLFLPNVEAFKTGTRDHPGPNDLYRMMGLNDNQIAIIQGGRYRRDIYWTSPKGCRLTANELGPLQLAIVGATAESDVREIQQFVEEHGRGWLWPYLDFKGVDHASLR